jgi:hypothetical protein
MVHLLISILLGIIAFVVAQAFIEYRWAVLIGVIVGMLIYFGTSLGS